uniref:CID domain-containing protein n=1 Tax=Clastoptera arizonana TaxID=38151 RepID=A0A1B6CBR7_9HEMI
MAGFTESALSKKLNDLNASQQSIQTLSLWLIHHRKHYAPIVKMWSSEIAKGDEGRQLTLMYLANDVIQNSRKKGPEFNKEFAGVLREAFHVIGGPKLSDKTRKCISRLLQVWEERNVYDKKLVEGFTKAFGEYCFFSYLYLFSLKYTIKYLYL